jgi:hypothetical protein
MSQRLKWLWSLIYFLFLLLLYLLEHKKNQAEPNEKHPNERKATRIRSK